jgi:hypothetical protein
MKLKGQTVKVNKKEYVLREMLGEGGFSMIYETNFEDIICKVQVLANGEIAKAYAREKYSYHNQDKCCNSYNIRTL